MFLEMLFGCGVCAAANVIDKNSPSKKAAEAGIHAMPDRIERLKELERQAYEVINKSINAETFDEKRYWSNELNKIKKKITSIY